MTAFKAILKFIGKGILLFSPLVAFMIYTSYTVDPSGIFHGEQFARTAVNILLEGEYAVSNYDSLDYYTRSINEALIMNSEPFDTIVLGSSRSMQINADMTGTSGRFLNMGVVGGDYQDLFGTFYLCVREQKLPRRVVLCIDPWIFNPEAVDHRSNTDWYLEFVKGNLGFDVDYDLPSSDAKWEALLDVTYFQSAVLYYRRDTSNDLAPSAVPLSAVYNQTSTVKMPDGTIVYEEAFRTKPTADVEAELELQALNPGLYGWRVQNYFAPDIELCAQFETYIAYMQSLGIEVIIYLPPYAPPIYDAFENTRTDFEGVFATETYLRTLAAEKGIAVYGSYNPYELELTTEDFYDGLHLRGEATLRFFNL